MGQVFFIFFSVVIGLTTYSLWSFGYFAKIRLKKCSTEPMVFVYKKFVGPSQEIIKRIDDLYFDLLDQDSIDTFKNIGVYYDKPNSITSRKCRSLIGCVLEKEDYRHVDALKEKYNVIELPSHECLTATYPYRGPLSISVAVLRVYPKIKKFLRLQSLTDVPVMEVYDDEQGVISYYTGHELPLPSFDAL